MLKMERCLVVIDDISSTSEWELDKSYLDNAGRIIVTTREKSIAKHCSRACKNMYCLDGLKDDAALDLFTKKVLLLLVSFLPLHTSFALLLHFYQSVRSHEQLEFLYWYIVLYSVD